MVAYWNFCTTGQAVAHAGSGANSVVVASGTIMQLWSTEAEAFINASTQYDWATNYATLAANFKNILGHCCACIMASMIVDYDASNFSSANAVTRKMNFLRDSYVRDIELLKTEAVQNKVKLGV